MLKIEISGENARELYIAAAQAFTLLAHGGNNLLKQTQPEAAPPTEPAPEEGAQPVGDVTQMPAEDPQPKRRGRKPSVTIEATANKPEPNDDLSDIAAEPKDDKPLTVDDMRQRVKDIIAAHQGRGNTMPDCVDYVKKLFKPFGIDQAAKVPADRFGEFMVTSQSYLDGSAK